MFDDYNEVQSVLSISFEVDVLAGKVGGSLHCTFRALKARAT